MLSVNLLPWRQQKKAEEAASLRAILFKTVLYACLSVASVNGWLGHRVDVLAREVEVLDQTMQNLTTRHRFSPDAPSSDSMLTFQTNLKAYQATTMQLFSILGQPQHHSVCFSKIVREKNRLYFSGMVSSAEDLTHFLKHWPVTNLFSEIKINELKQQVDHRLSFRFQALENNALGALDSV